MSDGRLSRPKAAAVKKCADSWTELEALDPELELELVRRILDKLKR